MEKCFCFRDLSMQLQRFCLEQNIENLQDIYAMPLQRNERVMKGRWHFGSVQRLNLRRIWKRSLISWVRILLLNFGKLGKNIVGDVLQWPINKWYTAFFRTDIKCDVVNNNNMAKAFNGWILDFRHKSIISKLEKIRVMVMKTIVAKRQFAITWIYNISLAAMKKLDKSKKNSCNWVIDWRLEWRVWVWDYKSIL